MHQRGVRKECEREGRQHDRDMSDARHKSESERQGSLRENCVCKRDTEYCEKTLSQEAHARSIDRECRSERDMSGGV